MRLARLAVFLVVGLLMNACGGGPIGEPAESSTKTTVVAGGEVSSLVVDGDFGPDDMMALLYLLERPDLDVLAVTVSGTGLVHCPDGAANAAAILSHLDRADIPVACGSSTPLAGSNAFPEEWRVGSDVLAESLGLQPFTGHVDDDAPGLLIRTIDAAERPVQVLVLGPMTNLASAFETDPTLPEKIASIVVMGGAFDVAGSVGPSYVAEWNAWVDPVAFSAVLASGVPLKIVPLDATNDVPATVFFFETLGRAQGTAGAKLVYRYFATHDFNLEGGSYFFWDPLAAVALVAPEVVTFEIRPVVVTDEGVTTASVDGVPTEIATSADRRAFEEEFLTVLNGGSFVEAEIPEPVLKVTYTGDSCFLEGDTRFTAQAGAARLPIELVNETESVIGVIAGTHDGASWNELQDDAARYQQSGIPPAYWVETASLGLYGKSVSGGSMVGRLDLTPGTHALVCSGGDDQLFLLTDIEVAAATP